MIPYVQTRLAKFVVGKLSAEFKTEISIDRARIKPFHRLSLYNVLIKDRQGDSLLFVSEIDALVDLLNLKHKHIHVKQIQLDSASVNIIKQDTVYNFSFLLEPRKKPEEDTLSVWKIGLGGINISDASLKYSVQDSAMKKTELKKVLFLNDLSLDVDSITLKKNHFGTRINNISFKLDNGFVMKTVKGLFEYRDGRLSAEKFFAESANSSIKIDSLNAGFTGMKNFKEYAGKSTLYLKIKGGALSYDDIKCFFPDFTVFNESFRFSGLLKGTIANLKGRNIRLSIGKNSHFDFNFSINGLPDLMGSFLYMDIKSLSTNVQDMERLLSISKDKALELPKSFSSLGKIKYKGNLTGFLSDLVAFGSFKTDLGSIKMDLGLKVTEKSDRIFYGGYLSTNRFNIGKLLGNEKDIGTLTMNMTVKGSRTSSKDFMVFLEGGIDSVDYKNHTFENILLNGFLSNKHFNGNVFLQDPYGALDFTGKIDMSKEIPKFDFFASLRDVRLDKFNVLTNYPDNKLSVDIETNIVGSRIEDILGFIRFDNLSFESPETTFMSDSLVLVAQLVDSAKHVVLESDLMEGELNGTYNFREIGKSVKDIVYNFLPALRQNKTEPDTTVFDRNNFYFVLNFKKIHDVVNLLFPKIDVSDAGMVMGIFNAQKKLIDIDGEFDYLNYDKFAADKVSFYLNSKPEKRLSFTSRFRTLTLNGMTSFDNLSIYNKAAGDSLQVNVFWNNWDEETNSGSIFTLTHFNRENDSLFTAIDILKSQLIVKDSLWNIEPAELFFYPEGFTIKSFNVWSNNQFIRLNGFQHKKSDDKLNVNIENIDIGTILMNHNVKKLKMGGFLSADVQIRNLYATPIITSDISIRNLLVNDDTLGVFNISSKYDSEQNTMKLHMSIQDNSKYSLLGEGDIRLKDKTVNMEFDVDNLPVGFLEMYIGHIIQDIKGTTSGKLFVGGPVSKPELTGRLNVNKLRFNVDLLKTGYTLSDSVFFEPNKIIFDNMTLTDRFNHKGVFKGTIGHTLFKDMTYDLFLDIENVMVLNTNENDNDVYYGTSFASGNMAITGATSNVKIDVVAKTVGDTKIFIPLKGNGSVTENDFVRFVGGKKDLDVENINNSYHVNISGLDVTLDMVLTPAAKIQVIFDSTVGDVLNGTGNGDLRVRIDNLGNVFFYGEYTIEEGDYMFTLQNLINKRFTINSGSTIRWDGSPYNALIDMKATYKLKASLYDLVAGSIDPASASEFQKRVPVDVILKLSDRLLNPAIKFEIKSSSLTNTNQNIIDEYITTEEELNQQVLSLLVMNRFYATEASSASESTSKAGNAAVVTTTEMLSNQLSHWLSQINNDFDIGVSYRPGDEVSSDEIEVALSTQMFNNWVTFSSNVGYGNYNTEDVSKIIGDFDIEVKLNRKGTIRAKAYTHTNNDIYETSPTTQGVGISFNEEFNTFKELMQNYWDKLSGKNRKKKKKEKEKEKQKQEQKSDAVVNNNNGEKKEEK